MDILTEIASATVTETASLTEKEKKTNACSVVLSEQTRIAILCVYAREFYACLTKRADCCGVSVQAVEFPDVEVWCVPSMRAIYACILYVSYARIERARMSKSGALPPLCVPSMRAF